MTDTGNNQNRTVLIVAAVGVGLCVLTLCLGGVAFAFLGGSVAAFSEGFSEGFSDGFEGEFEGTGGDFLDTTREDTISYGGSSTGNIGSLSEAHNIYFEGQAGDQVVIEALGQDMTDPRIRLLSPNGERIAENDDGGEGRDAYLEYTLPETGRYTIRVDVFTAGDYTVTVDLQ
jgi:hypothetical protein